MGLVLVIKGMNVFGLTQRLRNLRPPTLPSIALPQRYRVSVPSNIKSLLHYKLALSFLILYVSCMIMVYLGNTIAFMNFPRTSSPVPLPLFDYGHGIIPEFCPKFLNCNIQSLTLLLFYCIFAVIIISNPNGRLILQQLLHLNSLMFLTRTTTVSMAALPNPNPKCVSRQHDPVTYSQAVDFVVGRGFPPAACGDLIYSGHTAAILLCMMIFHKHHCCGTGSKSWIRYGLLWCFALIGILSTISCRSHYTVDVILAVY
eukprot:751989_1